MKALDIEAVQAFVLVADLKSFTRAAEALETTQSAVSLKIKRLEDGLGRRLLDRTPRNVRLSNEGTEFLPAARELVTAHRNAVHSFGVARRRLVIGVSHYIVGAELPSILKRVCDTEPGLTIEMHVTGSRDILDKYDQGVVDAALVFRQDHRQDCETIVSEEFGWIGVPAFKRNPGEPLRLATQAETCTVRNATLAILNEAGIPWTEVFIGGGLVAIGAAVSAGLAVAALGRRVSPPGTIDLGPRLGLPPLPSRDIVLHCRPRDRQAGAVLRALSAAIKSSVMRDRMSIYA